MTTVLLTFTFGSMGSERLMVHWVEVVIGTAPTLGVSLLAQQLLTLYS
jgi:hypothetical protein